MSAARGPGRAAPCTKVASHHRQMGTVQPVSQVSAPLLLPATQGGGGGGVGVVEGRGGKEGGHTW